MEENKPKNHSIPTGVISGIIFLVCYLALNLHVLLALFLSIICYVVIHKREKVKEETSEKSKQVKVSNLNSADKIQNAQEQFKKIKEVSVEIKNNDLRQKLVSICATCIKIIKKLEQSPELAENQGRQFLEYYLPTFLKIVSKYYELQQSGVRSKDISSAMKEIENNIVELEQAFLNVFDDVYHDELRNLSVEMEILKKSMDEDSFGV